MKQLFRRVAAALPGMEVKEENETMVEVNLQVGSLDLIYIFHLENCLDNFQKSYINQNLFKLSSNQAQNRPTNHLPVPATAEFKQFIFQFSLNL